MCRLREPPKSVRLIASGEVCPEPLAITQRRIYPDEALFRCAEVIVRDDADLIAEGDWDPDEQYITTAQAAAHFRVAKSTITTWTNRGLIHVAKWKHVGRRRYAMYFWQDIAAVECATRQSPNCRRAA